MNKLILVAFILCCSAILCYGKNKTRKYPRILDPRLNHYRDEEEDFLILPIWKRSISSLLVSNMIVLISLGSAFLSKILEHSSFKITFVTYEHFAFISCLSLGLLTSTMMDSTDTDTVFQYMVHHAYYNGIRGIFPFLIFCSCISLDAHTVLRMAWQIVIVCIPCLVTITLVIGYIMINIDGKFQNKGFSYIFLYGLAVAPIYPKFMTKITEGLGIRYKFIGNILEGECALGTSVAAMLAIIQIISFKIDPAEGDQFGPDDYLVPLVVLLAFCSVSYIAMIFLFKMVSNDATNLMVLTLSIPFAFYFFFYYLTEQNGVFICTFLGVVVSYQRYKLTVPHDQALLVFWRVVEGLVNCFCLAIGGFLFGVSLLRRKHEIAKITRTIAVLYVITVVVRFFMLFIFSFAMRRLDSTIRSKPFIIIAGWGGIHTSFNICNLILFYPVKSLDSFRELLELHVLGLTFVNLVFHMPFTRVILYMGDFTKVSETKLQTIENCLSYIKEKRERAIAVLKMDRFLSDANWPVVHKATMIRNPYTDEFISEKDDENLDLVNKPSICPECSKEVPRLPTADEIVELTKEAQRRVLKAQKVSYTRQFELGILEKSSLNILSQIIDGTLESDETFIKMSEILKFFKKPWLVVKFRKFLIKRTIHKVEHGIKMPRVVSRQKYYKIVMHPMFDVFIYIVILLNVFLCIVDYIRNRNSKSHWWQGRMSFATIFICNCLIQFVFGVEFVLKILAFSYQTIWNDGVKTYFRSAWNKFDFVLLLVGMFDIGIQTHTYIIMQHGQSDVWLSIMGKVLRTLRSIRVFKVLRGFNSASIQLCDMKIDSKMSAAYDIGKGFVRGKDEVNAMLPQMIQHKGIRDHLREQLEQERLVVLKELGLIQKDKPWITTIIKSKQAVAAILYVMGQGVEELRTAGWIDLGEEKILIDCLSNHLKYVNNLKNVSQYKPRLLFDELPWIYPQSETTDDMFSKISTRIYDAGQVVCALGELPIGIFIIVTGIFKVTYFPKKRVVETLKMYGGLPVVDFVSPDHFEEKVTDYLVPGNSLCELSILTERPMDCLIVADTPSQTYVISRELVDDGIDSDSDPFKGLEARLWKYICLKIALPILSKLPNYNSPAKLRYVVEFGFAPSLSGFHCFVNNTMIEDLVLIQGIVVDEHSTERFTAPCYLPPTCQNMLLPQNSQLSDSDFEVKILVIPVRNVDLEELLTAEKRANNVSEISYKLMEMAMSENISGYSRHKSKMVHM